jgi:vesicle-associated membrane protein 7
VLLGKIDPNAGDARMTIVYDNYVFHYVVEQQIVYLCMSDELNKYRVPYAFLSDAKERFLAQYGREAPLHAMAFCYNEEFAPVLRERMGYYNNPDNERAVDSIGAVKNQIDEVKENMVQNISNLLERGERLELLVEKTDNLNQQAFRFESSGRSLRRAMYWRQMRCYAGVGVAIIFLIFIAAASMCGGLDFRHCKK